MKVIGYTRVSSDKQDLQKQEHLLLKYAQEQDLRISDFIHVEISSRKDTKERRIDELLDWLNDGDVLLVAEPSRLGRNMFEVIDIINQLGENGVEVIFVRQPELSTAGPHREQIKEYLELGLSLRRIRTIINPQLERPISYPAYRYFVRQDPELLQSWQGRRSPAEASKS